jgi:hypothetical protein
MMRKLVVLELRGVQYWPISRRRWYTLTKMVANETTEEPLLLEATEGEDYGHGEEGEGSGSTMDEGFPDMEA